jgi:hypothetical protein
MSVLPPTGVLTIENTAVVVEVLVVVMLVGNAFVPPTSVKVQKGATKKTVGKVIVRVCGEAGPVPYVTVNWPRPDDPLTADMH